VPDVAALPVEAFLDAVARADLDTVTARLAPDAVLAVPSLRAVIAGREQVAAAVRAVLVAFPDLRYTSRSRYLAPGQVTDEAVLTGVRLGTWGEVPPSGRPHMLPARVVLEHDGLLLTRVTLWADPVSLRALVDDSVDLGRSTGLPVVTALRATVPAGEQRVIVGASREEPAPPPVTPSRPIRTDELNPAAAKAAALKMPMTRRARRTIVVTSAAAMAGAAALIVGWVARGALSTPVAPAAPVAVTTVAKSPPRTPAAASPTRTPTKTAKAFVQTGNLFTLNTDLTFDPASAHLNAEARKALAQIVDQVRAERRRGTITVNGFTDSDGTPSYNLALSRARADAVAAVLRAGLDGRGITVVARGYGEEREKASNDTPAGKALNRRVEITVPGQAGTPSS
jgi:outer membrane protein OmpA-like peptidoglycan-associated protein